MRTPFVLSAATAALAALAGAADAAPTVAVATKPRAPVAFVQGGVGFMELLHAEAGLFLTRRLSVEAMGAAVGVFGAKLGLGATYALGGAALGSAPRHAFLLHARFMLDPGGDQVGHGDHLGAYAVPAIGYGFLANSGFTARILAGPVITRERRGGPDGEAKLSGGIPFVGASFGYAF